jgi:flagellar hook protein FlgE
MALTALYTGSSGMITFSTMLDVVGNNIANINTPGYKDQSVAFEDLIYQTLSAGSPPSNGLGGTNPIQLGQGVGTGATETNFTQGTITQTGNPLDAAIQGNGFFVLSNGSQQLYTRAGAFAVNSAGYLIDPTTGEFVQRTGTVGEGTATVPGYQTPGNNNILIPFGAGIQGTETANVNFQGNLNNQLAAGQSVSTSIQVYDSENAVHTMTVTFTAAGSGSYNVTATVDGTAETVTGGPVTFDQNGLLASGNTLQVAVSGLADGASPQTINLNLGAIGSATGLTQFGTASTAEAVSQDGQAAGTLQSVSFDQSGNVLGQFSNGETIPIAQLAIASFSNQGGLLQIGNNYYSASPASGNALIGTAGSGGLGAVQGGALEGSNVNISTEFANLIIAQRGFQVNAETVTVANQVLAELANVIQ